MKSKLIKVVPLVVLATPLFALAAITTTWFSTSLINLYTILQMLIPFIIALAVIVFLWGVLKFVTAAGDEEKRKEGRGFIIWGLVGLAIMLALWGVIGLLISWTGIDITTVAPTIQTLPAY